MEITEASNVSTGARRLAILGSGRIWIWLNNWPLILFQLRLGWLFGGVCLVVTHRGRRSGMARRTALFVARYDPKNEESIVLAVYGERANWYRNLLHAPALEVWIGRRRYVPQQRFLRDDEVEELLLAYNREWPRVSPLFAWLLGWPSPRDVAANRQLAATLRAVAFRPLQVDRR
jgi:deazaflavin-dependent oxidoreductase (nitroreductase family)